MQKEVLNCANYWNRVIQLKRLLPDKTTPILVSSTISEEDEEVFNMPLTKK
ncbi:MAG: hypothetical protein KBC56_04875 [Flavobacterium sp.]|nr:hypothetical protein [Flavobacterium sp.]